MTDLFYKLGAAATACLRLLPAENAHNCGILALESGLLRTLPAPRFVNHGVSMESDLPGIGALRHPIGLAAGFDKNARALHGFEQLGFSFLEIGTVTPKPQEGNPKPRVFRDEGQRAIVNRMGFNSEGSAAVARRIRRAKWTHYNIPLGINVGKNKSTPTDQALKDYLQGLRTFEDLGRYFVINVSSPNTPGLRALATPEFIKELAQEAGPLAAKSWIKLDPDMERRHFQTLIETIGTSGFRGLVLSNTHRVECPQAGGQSGHPLLSLSNTVLEWAWQVHKGSIPTIATGGILSGVDVFHKIARGASAVQLYTALVYRGPGAVSRIYEELALELKLRGFGSVRDAIGCWNHW